MKKLLSICLFGILSYPAITESKPHHITELKAGAIPMTIDAPTYVQDDSLKPGDVSIISSQTQFGNQIVAPGATADTTTPISITIPANGNYRLLLILDQPYTFDDTVNVSPQMSIGADIIEVGSSTSVGGTTKTDSIVKVAAANLYRNWGALYKTVVLSPVSGATYQYKIRCTNGGTSTANTTFLGGQLTAFIFKS